MINLAALTSGRDIPSSRYRVRQHIAPLRQAGILVKEFIPAVDKYRPPPWGSITASGKPYSFSRIFWEVAKLSLRLPGLIGSWRSDITWLERKMLSGSISLEPLVKRPYVFDVDDAIWLVMPPLGRRAAEKIAKRAELVLAGNAYIADWFSVYTSAIRIIPTAVDTDRFRVHKQKPLDTGGRCFIIGWIGTASNYPGLYAIEKVLKRFLDDHKCKFLIVADKPPQFKLIPDSFLKFIKWSKDIELEALMYMDVGIMPLPDNEWSRGKCSYKMLQYMAMEIPVVVSPVGMNREVLSMGNVGFPARTSDDWYNALDELYEKPFLRRRLGKNGRDLVGKKFSRSKITPVLASIFKEVI